MTDDNLRLLLIDDNPDDRLLILRELRSKFPNLQTVEPTDRTSFVRALEEGDFNLAVTDYQLGWTNGLKVLKAVKKRQPECPVIMFTGTGNEEIAVKAMKAGLDDYIIKSPKHFVSLAISISSIREREQQRKALEEVESRYRRLFDGVPIGLYRLSPNKQFLEVNPALSEMLGYSDRQKLLRENAIERHIDRENRNAWKSEIDRQGIVKDLETQLRRCDGTVIWVRHNARAIQDDRGKLLYYEGALEDITNWKQAEIERTQLLTSEQQARTEAEKANRIKDEFLATLSHELRTPLNAMMGWVQLLRRGQLSTEQIERALEIIERNAQAQNQLIGDLLDVSRIIRGKMQLKLASVAPRWIIKAALDTVRPAADAKGIQLLPEVDSDVGLVFADLDRLQQILWNLLINAIKFTPRQGKVTIILKQSQDNIELQVIDTGKGINPEQLPYIFERFRQVGSPSTQSREGLGLGLAIVRHLVEMHGGTVSAESLGEGRGATFTVHLPRLEPTPTSEQEEASSETENNPLPRLDDLQILLVEDEDDARELVTLLLEKYGANVTPVASVQEALAAFDRQRPDILVSDIAMPGEDGYDLIQQIRHREQTEQASRYKQGEPLLGAIALTAYAREEDKQRALQAGFQMHLSKPVKPVQLITAIARLVKS